jgi:hypothetical protein
MTNLQENRLSMYLSFKDFQASYTTITDQLPNYTTNLSTFVNAIPQIQLIAEQQKTSNKGFTDLKNTYKEAVIVATADYARKLGVYAKFTKDAVLTQKIKLNESKLRQAPDTSVRDYAQIVYDHAQNDLEALGTYGITAATQTTLLEAITAYNASIGKPGANRTVAGQTTRQLGNLFKIADAALENLDSAVEIIRLSHSDFYLSYKNARKVIGTKSSSLAVRGLITDALTDQPIKGVSLLFSQETNKGFGKGARKAVESLVKKTAEKGGFNIKSLPSGMYTVAVKKAGYADHMATVAIADGELTELNIQLSKN